MGYDDWLQRPYQRAYAATEQREAMHEELQRDRRVECEHHEHDDLWVRAYEGMLLLVACTGCDTEVTVHENEDVDDVLAIANEKMERHTPTPYHRLHDGCDECIEQYVEALREDYEMARAERAAEYREDAW